MSVTRAAGKRLRDENSETVVERSPGSYDGGSEEEESPWLQRRDHPLLNDLVLSTVFEHVRKNDLNVCRRVCKKWNEIAIPFMRSKFEVKIYGDDSNFRTSPKAHTRRIRDFVNLFSLNKLGIPFAKYRIGLIDNTQALTLFLNICGPTAKKIQLDGSFLVQDLSKILKHSPILEDFVVPDYLEFIDAKFRPGPECTKPKSYSVKLFGPGPKSSKPKFPNLKKLDFGTRHYDGFMKKCPTFVEEIFTAAPNICDVEVRDTVSRYRCLNRSQDMDDAEPSIISTVLNVIEEQGKESSIESLHLYQCQTKHLEMLQKWAQKSNNGLKLKRLSFIANLNLTKDSMRGIPLSQSCKNTLEYFNLNDGSYYRFMEFPKMPNLKSLTFRISSEFYPSSVNLNDSFPVLKTLELNCMEFGVYDDNFYSQFESSSSSSPIVTSLSLERLNMTPFGLRRFLTVFPKLMKLKLHLSRNQSVPVNGAEILRMIWTQMTQLEQLDIESAMKPMEVDSILTGIPTQSLRKINIESFHLEKMTMKERMETIQALRNEYCEFSSITNLKNLTHLRFSNGEIGFKKWCNLTDLTGYLALYSMKHLYHLTVELCELTKTCCKILTTDLGLESWHFGGKNWSRIPDENEIIPSKI